VRSIARLASSALLQEIHAQVFAQSKTRGKLISPDLFLGEGYQVFDVPAGRQKQNMMERIHDASDQVGETIEDRYFVEW
jgi:hypothetical protein